MDLSFPPEQARLLGDRAHRIAMAGAELAAFAEAEPWLASECGIEVGALEARGILAGGAPIRILRAAEDSVRSGKSASLPAEDIEQVVRLEGVVGLSSARIAQRQAALEGQRAPSLVETVVPVLAGIVVDRAVGLLKSIF